MQLLDIKGGNPAPNEHDMKQVGCVWGSCVAADSSRGGRRLSGSTMLCFRCPSGQGTRVLFGAPSRWRMMRQSVA